MSDPIYLSELKRIKELANNDPKKQADLTAAACAMVRCADGVPKDDPGYGYLKALQDYGQSLTAEQNLLATQRGWEGRTYGTLFGYDRFVDGGLDWANQNKLGTRLAGALQGGLGIAGVAGSGALCTTGLGCAVGTVTGTVSADYAQAGLRQSVTGNATVTQGELVLQSLGLSPQVASVSYALLGLAPVGVEAVAVNRAISQASAQNAAARLSYTSIESFGAKGLDITPDVMGTHQAQALIREYQATGLSASDAVEYAKNLLRTGSELPSVSTMHSGEELIKVVPKTAMGDDGVSSRTAYFMTRSEYDRLSRLPVTEMARQLGLPAEQAIRGEQLGFEVYSMTPKPGLSPTVFTSKIAPVEQGGYSASGGALQTLAPNRSQWTDPTKTGSISGGRR